MTVHGPILRTLLRRALRRLIVDDRRTWRGIDLLVAAALLTDVIESRSSARHVGVMLPCSGAFPAAALAIWSLGRTVVPLNFLLGPDELDGVIQDSEIDLILTSRQLLEHMAAPPTRVPTVALEDLNFKHVPEPRIPTFASSGDLAALLYTSGTSGKPKGVMLTHANLRSNVRQCTSFVDFNPSDTLLGVLPQFHSFGLTVLTLLPLTVGCRIVYSARFVPTKIVKLLREHRPTCLVALPSMYNALLAVKNAGPEDFSSLRFIISGGEPLSQPVFEQFRERFGVRIHEGYGLTETAPVTNWLRSQEFVRGSVGKPVGGVTQRIVDIETGRELHAGEEGEIRFAGPNIMAGYYKKPDDTRAAFDEHGFFRTGDIGREDEQGRLYITGRLKEMIIVGGENVFPREIEEVLDAHPSVYASAVVGAPHESRGETPVAFVEVAEGAEFDERALRSWCRDRLAAYKVPKWVEPIEELPRSPTGKIKRRDLVERVASRVAQA